MDNTIKEMSKQFADEMYSETMADDRWLKARYFYEKGANAVLEEIEKELRRRMLEDYNKGAEEDEVAQGCMATMICFIEQLKEK